MIHKLPIMLHIVSCRFLTDLSSHYNYIGFSLAREIDRLSWVWSLCMSVHKDWPVRQTNIQYRYIVTTVVYYSYGSYLQRYFLGGKRHKHRWCKTSIVSSEKEIVCPFENSKITELGEKIQPEKITRCERKHLIQPTNSPLEFKPN